MKFVSGNRKQTTRDVILQALKESPQATVDALADAAQVSPVTVRHHLNVLQAEGLLLSTAVRRKVGRPHYVYSLSPEGHDLFPKKYARLSTRLLQELKLRFSEDTVTQLFVSVVEKIVGSHQKEFERLSFEQRLDYLVQLLADEGFLARWEEDDGQYRLIESSCPYISVGQTHGEVCAFDKGIISAVMQTEIKQHSCMLDGDACCQFTFLPAAHIHAN